LKRDNEVGNSGVGPKKILIVEDEQGISQVCRRFLSSEGFEVDIADNGSAAQGLLPEKDYDLCLLDIRTPIMDGKELYQFIIGEHPELADRVIFMTGDVVDEYTRRFLELAGRPFLYKPFTLDELKIIIEKTLGR
jgi:DNA-binding response OmpR family regulator